MSTLANLVKEDFGVKNESIRWLKAKEHDSIVVDKEKNIFYWNSQGLIGDVYTYLIKVRKWTPERAKEYLRLNNIQIPFLAKEKIDVNPYNKLVQTFFINGLNKREFFYKRGLTDETINKFLLGYFNGWSTIPIFEDGIFKNFQLRRDNPRVFCNYYKGIGQLIFNGDILEFLDEVFITEGLVDAMILVQNNIPAISTSGGVIQAKHYSKFRKIKRINIVFDNDAAGYEESIKTAKVLGEERCFIYLFQDFEKEKYDPVDFFKDGHTKDELLKLVYSKAKKAYQLDRGGLAWENKTK